MKKTLTLELTEEEYKTVLTALNGHGHYCYEHCSMLLQSSSYYNCSDESAMEGAKLAKLCGDRAFELKGLIRKAWEESNETEPAL